jgi:hypothetical protein
VLTSANGSERGTWLAETGIPLTQPSPKGRGDGIPGLRGVGGILNRASVPSQCLQGVGAVLNRTGNRTGERAASVPDAELVGCLSEGIARRGRRSAETPLRHGGLWDTERGGNAPPVPREWRNVEIPKQNASSPWPSPPKDEREPQMPVCIETSLSRQEEPYRKRTEACRGVPRRGKKRADPLAGSGSGQAVAGWAFRKWTKAGANSARS